MQRRHFKKQSKSMRYLVFLLFFSLSLPAVVSAQSSSGPYELSLKRELLFGSAGALSLGLATYLQNQLDANRPLRSSLSLTAYEDVNGFDRLGTNIGSKRARLWSDQTRDAGIGIGSLLLFGRETRRDAGKLAILYTETILLTSALTNLTKTSFRRSRPYVFAPDWDPDRTLSSGDRAAFLSGHTSLCAAGAFFFATVFTDYYPDSKLKRYVWGAAVTIPALTGYLRVRAAKHFPTDVIAGYALGAGIGYLVPTLHKKKILPKGMTIAPAGGGVYLNYQF